MTAKMYAAAVLLAGVWVDSAQAALAISTAATSNVNCSGGVCTDHREFKLGHYQTVNRVVPSHGRH
jgi:hypothetical protein